MTTLFRTSAESERRTLTRIGVGVVLAVGVAAGLPAMTESIKGKPTGVVSVAIDTPYVGDGVVDGTPVIIHGVKLGQVTGISSRAGGGVRLDAELRSELAAGLTDTMGIDFRPANYFGVTGINLIPNEGGRPLRDGTAISLTPVGNFSLQALLYRFGAISDVFDQRMIDVIDRVTRYTVGLTPLLETMIKVATAVADVQTVSTAQLLRNMTGTSVAIPGLTDALLDVLHNWRMTYAAQGYDPEVERSLNPFIPLYDAELLRHYEDNRSLMMSDPDAYVHGRVFEVVKAADVDVYAAVGKLESSHIYELSPVVDMIRIMADVVPKLVGPEDIADKLHELRSRLERMYVGSGDQRAMQVRIVLDELPGVAAPLGLMLGAAE